MAAKGPNDCNKDMQDSQVSMNVIIGNRNEKKNTFFLPSEAWFSEGRSKKAYLAAVADAMV